MIQDYDTDWLATHRPSPDAPSDATTTDARAALIAHGIRRQRARRRTGALAAAGVLVVGAAVIVAIGGGPRPAASGQSPVPLAIAPPRAIRGGATTVAPSTPLIRLAADVRLMPTPPQPGDATLVVRDTLINGSHVVDGAVYGGYDLYTDSGQYYYAPDWLTQLQQQVDTHQTVPDSGNEARALDTIAAAANDTPAQAREAR